MAPRRFSPESQCIGKQRYTRKADAKHAARVVEQIYGRMHAYRCVHCGCFHIGHRPPSTATANVMGPGVAANDPGPDRAVEVPDGANGTTDR